MDEDIYSIEELKGYIIVKICLTGCHDTTEFSVAVRDEELLEVIDAIASGSKEKSDYDCKPVLEYEVAGKL